MTRSLTFSLIAFALMAISFSVLAKPLALLLWNASASAPIGLYARVPADHLSVGDLVIVKPPAPLASFLEQRRYIGHDVVLIKRVAALGGQSVCRIDRLIAIDGKPLGFAQSNDHLGRPLPIWQGCQVLAVSQVFLMTTNVPASLDGRYFGPLDRKTIIGRALPLWTFGGG